MPAAHRQICASSARQFWATTYPRNTFSQGGKPSREQGVIARVRLHERQSMPATGNQGRIRPANLRRWEAQTGTGHEALSSGRRVPAAPGRGWNQQQRISSRPTGSGARQPAQPARTAARRRVECPVQKPVLPMQRTSASLGAASPARPQAVAGVRNLALDPRIPGKCRRQKAGIATGRFHPSRKLGVLESDMADLKEAWMAHFAELPASGGRCAEHTAGATQTADPLQQEDSVQKVLRFISDPRSCTQQDTYREGRHQVAEAARNAVRAQAARRASR